MFAFLAKLFIKDRENISDPQVRRSYGVLCAATAIALNILLATIKLIMAQCSGAFSIRADALNNLADAGGSLLILTAFYLAGARPRPDRPFGHGRIEYVAGLIVSWIVVSLGIELGRNSIACILSPNELNFSWTVVATLVAAIAVKCYMSFFIISTAKKIGSDALKASGMESLSDTISTIAALFSLLIYALSSGRFNLDGWFGLFVSILILKAGLSAAWSVIKQLLGTKPDQELVNKIVKICMSYEEVVGVHDLVVHDYGPGRFHVSIHCEVPGNGDVYVLHDAMDRIMVELDEKLGCESVVHMDPICVDDERVVKMRKELQNAVKQLSSKALVHDFRVTIGPTHTNVIFDCVVPYDVEPNDEKAKEKVKKIVRSLWENAYPVIKLDRPYA